MFRDKDITYSGIAVSLGPPPKEPKSLSQDDFEKLLGASVGLTSTIEGGLIITSTRAQKDVTFIGTKLNVRDLSGDEPTESSPVPKIVKGFLGLIGASITAYGLNYDIAFKLEGVKLSGEWIAKKFINKKEIMKYTDLDIGFAAVRLHIPDGKKMWNLNMEGRGGPKSDRLRVELNIHEDTTKIPADSVLKKEYEEGYKRLMSFLKSITK